MLQKYTWIFSSASEHFRTALTFRKTRATETIERSEKFWNEIYVFNELCDPDVFDFGFKI